MSGTMWLTHGLSEETTESNGEVRSCAAPSMNRLGCAGCFGGPSGVVGAVLFSSWTWWVEPCWSWSRTKIANDAITRPQQTHATVTRTLWSTADVSTATRTSMSGPMTMDERSISENRDRLIAALREHALVIGEVVLTSGATAQYLVDAKRAILLRAGFDPLAALVAAYAREWDATAVGGMTMGADPIACAALAGGADVKAFFVRKEAKDHGLARRIEGPVLEPGDRCMLVEDVVTTGGSTLKALQALKDEGHSVCGIV